MIIAGRGLLLSTENPEDSGAVLWSSPFSPLLPGCFYQWLGQGCYWIRFEEDRKLGGTANVLDEGAGTKQNSG